MTPESSFLVLNILCLFLFLRVSLCNTQSHIMERRTLMPKIEGKIIGGFQVPIKKFPFAVQIFNFGSFCGGSILSSWTVLTAAHCFNHNLDQKGIEVHVGARYIYDMTASRYSVWYIVLHEDYNKIAPFACDIALVFTSQPIQFSGKTQKALLVNSMKWMKKQETFTVTGWGSTSYGGAVSSTGLLEVRLQFVSSGKCQQQHHGLKFSPDMFCLYGDGERDTCQGDSGGAVLWNGLVVGLVSHGEGCAHKNKPGVYTNVYHFRLWIEKKMKEARRKYCLLPPR